MHCCLDALTVRRYPAASLNSFDLMINCFLGANHTNYLHVLQIF